MDRSVDARRYSQNLAKNSQKRDRTKLTPNHRIVVVETSILLRQLFKHSSINVSLYYIVLDSIVIIEKKNSNIYVNEESNCQQNGC